MSNAQIRNRGSVLHVQTGGNQFVNNRNYGAAFDISNSQVPDAVLAAISESEHTLSSLAGTSARYLPATLGTTLDELVVEIETDGAVTTFTVPLSEVSVFNQ